MNRIAHSTMFLVALALGSAGCQTEAEKPAVQAKADEAKKPDKKKDDKKKKDEAKPAPIDPKVAKAAALAAELSAKPEDADAILAKHELDRDQLDTLMYEIAADEELASAYRLARAEQAPGGGGGDAPPPAPPH